MYIQIVLMDDTFICPYRDCRKPKDLSAEDTKLIEPLKNRCKNMGGNMIPLIDRFVTSCNAPNDPEISDLNNSARKLAGAYNELNKLPEHHKAHFCRQLDQIGNNILDTIIALVPIPHKCRHEIPSCERCGGVPGCEWCPDNEGVDQRNKRWKQHIRKCDAGSIIRIMKSHQNGSKRVAARANRSDYPEEDIAAGLFDE
jgi:hypothetical protein